MRPRVFPAEDLLVADAWVSRERASMRPRVFPAEDDQGTITGTSAVSSFNEAAGIPRGRRCNVTPPRVVPAPLQ